MKRILRLYRILKIMVIILLTSNHLVFSQINPAEDFGELFKDVQMASIFQDQKRFADCVAKVSPDSIRKAYSFRKPILILT